MVPIAELWLPILVAAVFVFVASSVIHMALPIHKGDYKQMAGEGEVLAAMRAQRVAPGQYMFPCPGSMKELSSPEMQERFRLGPVGTMVLRPTGPPAIGKSLVQWFVLCLVVSFFVAYLAGMLLPRGAEPGSVFRFTATAAFLGYGVGAATESIWKGVSWVTTAKFVFDGLVYGLVTAAAFAWLWPASGA